MLLKLALLVLLPQYTQPPNASRPLLTIAYSNYNISGTWSNHCIFLFFLLGCLTSIFRSPFGSDLLGSCLPTTTGLPPLHSTGGPHSSHFSLQLWHLPSLYSLLAIQSFSSILALSRTAVTLLTMIWSLMTLGLQMMKTPRPSFLMEVSISLGPAITEVLFGRVGTTMTMSTRLMSPCSTSMRSMITTAWGWSQTCLLPCRRPLPIPPASIF